jgi:hypothetical protein
MMGNTKAFDQVAREEARGKHADHMPLQHQGGIVKRHAAHLHGQRGGRHQQVHHAIAQRLHPRRHDEHRLSHDDAQRPTFVYFAIAPKGLGVASGGNWMTSDITAMDSSGHHRQRQVGAHEGHVHQRAGAAGQVGAQHSAHQTACQYQRDTAFP